MKRISPLIDPAARKLAHKKHRMVGFTVFVLAPLAWMAVIVIWWCLLVLVFG